MQQEAKWKAEMKQEAKEKLEKEKSDEYRREQERWKTKHLLSSEEQRLKMELSFMYEPPPGVQSKAKKAPLVVVDEKTGEKKEKERGEGWSDSVCYKCDKVTPPRTTSTIVFYYYIIIIRWVTLPGSARAASGSSGSGTRLGSPSPRTTPTSSTSPSGSTS